MLSEPCHPGEFGSSNGSLFDALLAFVAPVPSLPLFTGDGLERPRIASLRLRFRFQPDYSRNATCS